MNVNEAEGSKLDRIANLVDERINLGFSSDFSFNFN